MRAWSLDAPEEHSCRCLGNLHGRFPKPRLCENALSGQVEVAFIVGVLPVGVPAIAIA
jgi:hypothetical protein